MAATGAMWETRRRWAPGLPILNVLRTDLIAISRRQVNTIEGIFSGTLSYLFNSNTA